VGPFHLLEQPHHGFVVGPSLPYQAHQRSPAETQKEGAGYTIVGEERVWGVCVCVRVRVLLGCLSYLRSELAWV
jgi:hypothetical protein